MHKIFALAILFTVFVACSNQATSFSNPEKIILDNENEEYGYYLIVKPKDEIKSVLVLLPGFGQKSEDVFLDTQFHKKAYSKNILVVAFAGRTRLACDQYFREKMNLVMSDLVRKTNVNKENFVLGGFSAGGTIALRYTELCHQYPDEYPIQPKGVFMADAPVDLFNLWRLLEKNIETNISEVSVNEAKMVGNYLRKDYSATPDESPEIYVDLSPFSIDQKYGENEKHLMNVAVRSYHDIDVTWRLKNRNQSANYDNFIANSELINRLMLMGNNKAEFIQTFETGYRKGERHPHSWSIVDEEKCLAWMIGLMN